jgi:hypothetical protein
MIVAFLRTLPEEDLLKTAVTRAREEMLRAILFL